MSTREVYQWYQEIHERLPLNKWQALGLAIVSLGIVLSERSTLSKIAEQLGWVGKADSVERRIQRWLANPRIVVSACCRAWAEWVIKCLGEQDPLVLLVDLTKLGEWMDVMVVGLAYRQRCIPLAWRCLKGQQKWDTPQVALIAELLNRIAPAVPEGVIPLVEADRGIGSSSKLATVVAGMGWHFLFRVQDTVRVRLVDGQQRCLSELVRPGKSWQGSGEVFKKGDWMPVSIHLLWKRSMDAPWCLVTNAPQVAGAWYAVRMWQEESFRDLKGGGWQWQHSQVRLTVHAERLLLALALAYTWTLSLGTWAIRADRTTLRQITRGRRRTYSVFRLGLRYFRLLTTTHQPLPWYLYLCPARPFP